MPGFETTGFHGCGDCVTAAVTARSIKETLQCAGLRGRIARAALAQVQPSGSLAVSPSPAPRRRASAPLGRRLDIDVQEDDRRSRDLCCGMRVRSSARDRRMHEASDCRRRTGADAGQQWAGMGAGWRCQQHRHHSGSDLGRAGRGAARRDGHGDQVPRSSARRRRCRRRPATTGSPPCRRAPTPSPTSSRASTRCGVKVSRSRWASRPTSTSS